MYHAWLVCLSKTESIAFDMFSLAVIVQGNVIRPRVRPADRIDVPNLKILTNTIKQFVCVKMCVKRRHHEYNVYL